MISMIISLSTSLRPDTFDGCRKSVIATADRIMMIAGEFYKKGNHYSPRTEVNYFTEVKFFTRETFNIIDYCGNVLSEINRRVQDCFTKNIIKLPDWNYEQIMKTVNDPNVQV